MCSNSIQLFEIISEVSLKGKKSKAGIIIHRVQMCVVKSNWYNAGIHVTIKCILPSKY